MSNTVHLNWAEKLVLFDILDLAKDCPLDLSNDQLQVIDTVEQQLNRYGDNHEQHREANS